MAHGTQPQATISIHVLRVEDDATTRRALMGNPKFQSTSSVWRTTRGHLLGLLRGRISIHVLRVEDDIPRGQALRHRLYFNPRPPCGGRRPTRCPTRWPTYFNPRPPCGGRRSRTTPWTGRPGFQSTSSVWRTTKCRYSSAKGQKISIHVLRVEDDRFARSAWPPAMYFNPRPPCGGRPSRPIWAGAHGLFQSTSSVWRTTI